MSKKANKTQRSSDRLDKLKEKNHSGNDKSALKISRTKLGIILVIILLLVGVGSTAWWVINREQPRELTPSEVSHRSQQTVRDAQELVNEGQPDQARTTIEEGMETGQVLDAEYHEAYLTVARAWRAQDDHEASYTYYERADSALETPPNIDFLIEYAAAALAAGKKEVAVEKYRFAQEIIDSYPALSIVEYSPEQLETFTQEIKSQLEVLN